ncbi:molybdopterin-binding protein, partial [Streptomyces bauhiniae]
ADRLVELREAVAHSPADVVITTGSTAAGPVDFLHETLRLLDAPLIVDSVSVRPGHPMLLARLPATADGRARHLVGLPGNPLAA